MGTSRLLDHYEGLEATRAPATTAASDLGVVPLGELLARAAGTWKHGDGLAWQVALRAEWDGRGTPTAEQIEENAAKVENAPSRSRTKSREA